MGSWRGFGTGYPPQRVGKMKQWFVLYTGINQETLARRGLSDKLFECYCPMGSKPVRHARKTEIRVFPVFSRYLFILTIPNAENLSQVRDTDGVIDILTNNWLPVAVDNSVIDEIKTLELAGAFDIKPPRNPERRKWSKGFAILKAILDPVNIAIN